MIVIMEVSYRPFILLMYLHMTGWMDFYLFIYLLFTNRGSFSCSANCPPIAICPCFACESNNFFNIFFYNK
jgi:hypothetical protein